MSDAPGHVLVRGGMVIDGTGAAARKADVRVRHGTIVELAPGLRPDGEVEIDAAGAVVTPGFIDNHTHFDFQLFWDPFADPMPQHGVTTILIGNCSLSLSPVHPENVARLVDAFCFIEDLPAASVQAGVPWQWETYAEYRDALGRGGLGVDVAALVGHTPLRMYVMGDDAWDRQATALERAAMAAELDRALREGAFGLSTSFFDRDSRGRPVPSRLADDAELVALLDVVARHAGRLVEFIPDVLGADPMADLRRLGSLAGDRVPLTWNGLFHLEYAPEVSEHYLQVNRQMVDKGVRIWPQFSPRTLDFRVDWDQTMLFMGMPAWNRYIGATGQEKWELLGDHRWQEEARADWDLADNAMFPFRRLDRVRFVEVVRPELGGWLGRTLADLVAEWQTHPSDALARWLCENDLRPGVVVTGIGNGDPDAVGRLLASPEVIVGASDAGAHLQMQCPPGDSTLLLTRHVREREDLDLPTAVHALTGRQAEVLALSDRGVVAVGRRGDLVVFALDELDWAPDTFVADLPAGMRRLRRPAGGYRTTVLAGVVTQEGGQLTGRRPGLVLRGAN
jgi:N-acyl-D-aspartate/D-glutamate deacylase